MGPYGFDAGSGAASGLLQGLAQGLWQKKEFDVKEADRAREQEMFKLQKDLLNIKKQQNQLELGKQKMAMSFIEQLTQMQTDAKSRTQGVDTQTHNLAGLPGPPPQEGSDKSMLMQGGGGQGGGIGMQAAMNDPMMAMIMKFATGLDLPSVVDSKARINHYKAIEKDADERIDISRGQLGQRMRGNDIRERQMQSAVTPVPFTDESGAKGTTFVPKYGTAGQTVQTSPRGSQQPIAEDNLPLWVNDKLQTPPVGTTPAQAMEQGFQRITAAQKSTVQAIGSVDKIFSQITDLMKKVYPDDEEGAMGRLGGGISRKVGAATQANPDAAQLESLVSGTVAPIIRSLGEKGALANEDVARALNLMPKLTDSGKVAWRKINQLKELFKEVKANAMGGAPPADFVFNPESGALEPVQ